MFKKRFLFVYILILFVMFSCNTHASSDVMIPMKDINNRIVGKLYGREIENIFESYRTYIRKKNNSYFLYYENKAIGIKEKIAKITIFQNKSISELVDMYGNSETAVECIGFQIPDINAEEYENTKNYTGPKPFVFSYKDKYYIVYKKGITTVLFELLHYGSKDYPIICNTIADYIHDKPYFLKKPSISLIKIKGKKLHVNAKRQKNADIYIFDFYDKNKKEIEDYSKELKKNKLVINKSKIKKAKYVTVCTENDFFTSKLSKMKKIK